MQGKKCVDGVVGGHIKRVLLLFAQGFRICKFAAIFVTKLGAKIDANKT